MKFFCIVLAITSLLLHAQDYEQELHQLFADAWQFQMQEFPLTASYSGDNRYNDRLDSVSVADYERRLEVYKSFIERLESISKESLSPQQQINYAIFERLQRNNITEISLKSYLIPITNRSGFHIEFADVPGNTVFSNKKDYQDYIKRLIAFQNYTEQHIELMKIGVKEGYVLPKIVLEGYEETVNAHIVTDLEQSIFYRPFKNMLSSIDNESQKELQASALNAIKSAIIPSYQKLLSFIKETYYPNCRNSIATKDLPNGKAFYEYCVHKYTTLEMTPQEVHNIGLQEVERIKQEMQQVIKKTGFEGSFSEFLRFLRTDERFYAKTKEELLKEVSYILKKMDGALPNLFKKLPRTPYGIKEVPDYIAPRTTTAYYMPPAGDGTRAGYYFVNTYNLKSRPLYELEALSLHEAVPGHHLQIALQQELQGLPEFRRFSHFTAFVEGWALYSERLGLEVGFYQDPYSDFGRLTYEMWRACRLVVDTGMHYLGWSRQESIDFLAQNTALSLHNVETEIDRYISWPGQALAYKTGELKIRELRAKAEKELGKSFDIRTFHDIILSNGSIPLKILENNVDLYIAQQLNTAEEPKNIDNFNDVNSPLGSELDEEMQAKNIASDLNSWYQSLEKLKTHPNPDEKQTIYQELRLNLQELISKYGQHRLLERAQQDLLNIK